MRKIGIYYAFWTNDWDVDFIQFIPKVKKLGFDILEINGGTIVSWTEFARQNLVNQARSEGIELSYGLGNTIDHDVSSPDEKVRECGVRFMTEMIKSIGRMGGGVIQGSTYCAWPNKPPKGESKQHYIDQSLKSMKELATVAEDNNVILNCEVLNRFEQFILNTCAEAVPFVKEINSPNIGILLDTFHMNIEEESLSSAILKAGPYLKGLHCGETDRKPVGMGRVPWIEIRRALDQIGFDGPIIEEPFVMPGGQVGQDISVWRNVIENPNLDDLAAQSAQYMRRVLVN